VAHPYDWRRKGHWQPAALARIAPLVDAIEGFNARCFSAKANAQAAAFAAAHGLPLTAGSDAHTPAEIGRGAVVLPPFSNAETLKTALSRGEIQGETSPPWVVFASRYAKWVKKIGGKRLKPCP